MKVTLANASRSALAPALKRSEKWSNAADMVLEARQILTKREISIWQGMITDPHPMCSQNLIIPAAKPWQDWDRVWTAPRGTSYFRATT